VVFLVKFGHNHHDISSGFAVRCPDLDLDADAKKFLAHAMEPHGMYGNRPGFIVELAFALHGQKDAFPSRLCRLIPALRKALYGTRSHVVNVFLKNQRRLLSASFAEWDEKTETKKVPNPKKKRKNERKLAEEGLQYATTEQSLIIRHYAHLSRLGVGYSPHHGGWVLHKVDNQLVVQKSPIIPFLPKIVFPVAEDECFDVPGYPAMTARHVFSLPSEDGQSNANSNQSANDGMGLEALFCASAMCASHMQRDAKDQLPLSIFISQLAYHLIDKTTVITLSKDAADILARFERPIPRFAPPNMCLCDYYDNVLSLGTITRTKNSDHMDCVAYGDADEDPIFTGEMKAWSKPVDVGELLARVPDDTTLHLIACNQAPTSKERPNTMLRTVSVEDGVLSLHQMQDDPEEISCLVLFFVLTEMGLYKK